MFKGISSAIPENAGSSRGSGLAGITGSPPSIEEFVMDENGQAIPVKREGKKIPGLNAAIPTISQRMVRIQTEGGPVEITTGQYRRMQLDDALVGVTSPTPEVTPVSRGANVLFGTSTILNDGEETGPGGQGRVRRVLGTVGNHAADIGAQIAEGEMKQAIDVLLFPGLEAPRDEKGNLLIRPGVTTVPLGLPGGEGEGVDWEKVRSGAGTAWGVTKGVGRLIGRAGGAAFGGARSGIENAVAGYRQRQAKKAEEARNRTVVIEGEVRG